MYKNGKPFSQVTMYETKEAKDYKKKFIKCIKEQVKLQNWIKSDNKFQKYFVDCTYFFPRIDMDSNNYYKLLLDSMTESEVLWIDDVQSCERTQGIFYDSLNPRIEIVISPVDFIGIFPNESYFNEFKSNCETCSKYKNGKCNVFQKSFEGRIQEDIIDFKCNKYKLTK